jgi:hypothetical protein
MRTFAVCFTLLLCLIASAPAAAQRIFDNFDTIQGVNVIQPPAAPIAVASTKKRRGKNGKWEVVVGDKVRKTVDSRTANVTDGLAIREGGMSPSNFKLTLGSNTQLKGFTTGNMLHDSYIVDSAHRYGIDPLLIYSQMHQESTFNLNARSPKGASGLMQLMPGTARRFGVTKIYDPQQNINGDVVLALAGYNAGEGAVMKYGGNVPPYRETQEYVRRITSRYNQISDGRIAQYARKVTPGLANRLEQKVAPPLTILEANAMTVRLPDGRMMLVNQ